MRKRWRMPQVSFLRILDKYDKAVLHSSTYYYVEDKKIVYIRDGRISSVISIHTFINFTFQRIVTAQYQYLMRYSFRWIIISLFYRKSSISHYCKPHRRQREGKSSAVSAIPLNFSRFQSSSEFSGVGMAFVLFFAWSPSFSPDFIHHSISLYRSHSISLNFTQDYAVSFDATRRYSKTSLEWVFLWAIGCAYVQ